MGISPGEQAHRPRTGRPVPIGTESGAEACGKPQARPPVTGKTPGARVIPQSRHPFPVAWEAEHLYYVYIYIVSREIIGKIDKKRPRKLKQPRTQFFVFGFGIWQVN